MTNKQFQDLLSLYPDDMPVKLLPDHRSMKVIDITNESLLFTSETAHIDDTFPEDEWDTEDGKVIIGDGQRYLLLNPIIH